MKIELDKLTLLQLNWAVAKSLEVRDNLSDGWKTNHALSLDFSPVSNWGHGGEIIEAEKMTVGPNEGWGVIDEKTPENKFIASDFIHLRRLPARGETPLIAAMKLFVKIYIGNEVEIPDDICFQVF